MADVRTGMGYTDDEMSLALKVLAALDPALVSSPDPVTKAQVDALLAKARAHMAQFNAQVERARRG